jgi:hypothetical protein
MQAFVKVLTPAAALLCGSVALDTALADTIAPVHAASIAARGHWACSLPEQPEDRLCHSQQQPGARDDKTLARRCRTHTTILGRLLLGARTKIIAR